MITWTLAHPYMTFWLSLILGMFAFMLAANVLEMISVIFRGWKPQVCEECQMSLLDEHNDPHEH